MLDGQQRITSIFSVFQNELIANNDSDWIDIYFDFEGSAIMDSGLIPRNGLNAKYEAFIQDRTKLLVEYSNELVSE